MYFSRIFKKILFAFIILSNLFIARLIFAEENIIIIYGNNIIVYKNKNVFGTNVIAYDPATYENPSRKYYGYSDYGAGIWDPKLRNSVKEPIRLMQDAGITIVRFPGGCGTHHYNWKEVIKSGREHFLLGLDEFLEMTNETRVEPIITLSYFTGDQNTDADLIEYLNLPNDGSNLNGGTDWAAERARNGHPEPYHVRYFEVGNEIYHGDHRVVKEVEPEEYAKRYLEYYLALKRVDPSVKIGAVLYNGDWNRRVIAIIKDKIDFGILHTYPTPAWGKVLEVMNPKDIYAISFAKIIFEDEVLYQDTLELLRNSAGSTIPLAITEYNGGFVQDEPIPYRHALGTALLNAELLRIFMKPENNIFMANNWNFANDYFGMVANGFDGTEKTLYSPYYKRPNYYVFEMYHKHFGNVLLYTEVKSESVDVGEYRSFKSSLKNLFKKGTRTMRVPYLSVNASKSQDGNKVYLMVINKNIDRSMTSAIELKDFIPGPKGSAWVLNGPSIDSTNESKHDTVKITSYEFEIKGNPFEFTFEPHSLTAIELERR